MVHEAFLRLIQGNVALQDRAHFFALASRLMRRVLVDHAKSRGRQKRGVPQDEPFQQDSVPRVAGFDVISLDDALESLQQMEPRLAQVIELYYFGGLTYDQIAAESGASPATVHRDIRLARAWLHARNRGTPAHMIPRGRWQQIQSLFEQVIDAPPAEQAARLASACGADGELLRSVESLLASDQSTEDPLMNVISEAAESLLVEHQDRLVGTRVGNYRIVSILGHGGMSTVYRGERDDAKYQQTVAIKVLHHAAMHPRLRSRLHSERHILATLAHPSIARLIDSGELEDGTPYLVMEHVDGESIDAYCDSRTLFVRERLELFVRVCAAVQYAHRNLVVHRDIKAANILVTNDGTPKLLDFGIAKLLAPESMRHTVPVTRLQERILTPENAAPEQVLGRSITTATDIYALGVLLYQLLTGRSPYRLMSYSQLQLERAICMDDPMRPSQIVLAKLGEETDADRSRLSDRRGLSPLRLRARLSGDLDAIIAMAMRKEPDRRYPSVEALADDISRHLLGRPVLARQGDWRYNTAKFMRRHLLPLSVVAAAFLGLALIAGVTLWQNHRIEMARDATAQERDRAQQVSAFLVDVFSQADPYTAQGRDTTAKELLDRGAAKIGSQNLQPEVRAQLLESIGVAYRRQGLTERAIPVVRAGRRHPAAGKARRYPAHRGRARESRARAHRGRPSGVRGGLSAASARDVAQGRSVLIDRDGRYSGSVRAIRAERKRRPPAFREALRGSPRHLPQHPRQPTSVGRRHAERSRSDRHLDG